METHDKKINNLFYIWLTISFGLILTMIIIGGLTRLTDSGLSITKWELFKGILPPLTQTQWEMYFNQYKKLPQYILLNSDMSLKEFKIIFYWEYIHRLLGRLIGIFFLIPLLYFHFSHKIEKNRLLPCYIIFFLILVQGIIGWYMVKSGLLNAVTVSHYRLSLHLTMAILIAAIIYWQIINIKNINYKNFFQFSFTNLPYLFLIFLIFVQIIMGAFVSGLDAGKIYQTWPLMGESYVPDDFDINGWPDVISFDNHSLVQFYHRNIAYILSLYIFFLSFFIFKNKKINLYKPMFILLAVVLIQINLGIFTLLSDLNIIIALAHQISGVILVLSTLNLYFYSIK